MKTYVTKAGDTYDIIAKNVLGKEVYAKQLMEANTDYITTVIFPAGVELKIPEIDEEITAQSNNNLPPWRSDNNVNS